jgi:hypothetical protein
MEELTSIVETEQKLRDVWHLLPEEIADFPIETWTEMTVTVAEPDSPYRPVNRFRSLLQESNVVRYLRPEVALMEPCFNDLLPLIDEGVSITLIDRPSCHSYFISAYPEQSMEMERRDNFTVLEHDDLPQCGIGLLDNQVAVSCFTPDSGTIQALIDTEVQTVRDWAESTYSSFEEEARPVILDSYMK